MGELNCFSQAIYTVKVGIKPLALVAYSTITPSRSPLPQNQDNLLDFPSNGCVSPYNAVAGNIDIISLKQFTHIHVHRHSTIVTYVLCAMIHVCHCRHQHLDNWAFNVCVCVCVCVCNKVVYLSFTRYSVKFLVTHFS